MRLKALLIDDEANILHNLKLVLPWEQLDISVVGTARNGVQALDVVREHQPELILCDIRMPVMDGIRFLEELSELGSESEVIMLTGYQDFEYARSVLRYGVKDYILKPIDYDELAAVIGKLARTIRTRRRTKNSEEQRLGQTVALAYEKLLYDCLMDYGPAHPETLLQGQASIPPGARYLMLLVDFDDYGRRMQEADEQERKLLHFTVRTVMQEILSREGFRHAVLPTREGEMCVVIERNQMPDAVSADDIRNIALKLQQHVAERAAAVISVCLHPGDLAADELSRTFRLLQRTLHLAASRSQSILTAGDGDDKSNGSRQLWEPVDSLVSALKQNRRGAVDLSMQQLSRQFYELSGRSLSGAEKMAHFIVLHLLREMRELGVLSPEQEQDIWRITENAGRVKDHVAVVRLIVDESLGAAADKKTGDVLMHAAKDYIHRHLSRDIGIDELADTLGISPSYFSLLFKQHFGYTFVEYVTAERMEMAKSMLVLTGKSVTEISKSVGYAERRYFTKVFQKMTGEIPSEYREKRRGT